MIAEISAATPHALVLALLIFGFLPGAVLRVIVLLYPKGDPRRQEMIAEVYEVPRLERPFWVLQQLEVAISTGLPTRWRPWVHRLSAYRSLRQNQSLRNSELMFYVKAQPDQASYWGLKIAPYRTVPRSGWRTSLFRAVLKAEFQTGKMALVGSGAWTLHYRLDAQGEDQVEIYGGEPRHG